LWFFLVGHPKPIENYRGFFQFPACQGREENKLCDSTARRPSADAIAPSFTLPITVAEFAKIQRMVIAPRPG
jgi:hypothetical protein